MSEALENQVLVLNRLWQPVHICTARRAIGLLFLGHAQVVGTSGESQFATHDFESWVAVGPDGEPGSVVRTVKCAFLVPKVIVLAVFDRLPRQEVKFSRENVFQRDRYMCQYCGKNFERRELNLDHVIPRDKGGRTVWENVVCSCIRCNTKKGNKLPREVGMVPMNAPKAPRWSPLPGVRAAAYDESWRLFLEPNGSEVDLSH